jgi:hypothetical protein
MRVWTQQRPEQLRTVRVSVEPQVVVFRPHNYRHPVMVGREQLVRFGIAA